MVKKRTPAPLSSATVSPPHRRRRRHKHNKSRFISKFFRTISQMGISITKKHLKKKPRLANTETESGLDLITNLHESVVSNILSRLPIKDAVRTSILSKDWKRKWVSIDKIDTDINCWGRSCHTFPEFLEEILVSHDHLRSFRATFLCAMSTYVQKWVNAALGHNLEYLDVNINTNRITIRNGLVNSNSLRELRVVQPFPSLSDVKVTVAEKSCAPKLTSLSLHNIAFVNRNLDSSTVLFDFPVLERLELIGTTFSYGKWWNVKTVEIYAPLLTSLTFEPTWLYRIRGCDYSIKIVAPKLTRFSCFNDIPKNLVLDWSSIVYVFLAAEDNFRLLDIGSHATDLVNGFTNLEELTLSHGMAEVLSNGPPLHHHDKLKRLTLLTGTDANQLFELLHAMPSLKFFSVNVDCWQDYDYEAMEITPSCIASHLEEVVLQVFSGDVPQYELAEFLLKAAKKLKKFTITTNHVGLSEEIKKVLSAFVGCTPSPEICSRLPDIEPSYAREIFQG